MGSPRAATRVCSVASSTSSSHKVPVRLRMEELEEADSNGEEAERLARAQDITRRGEFSAIQAVIAVRRRSGGSRSCGCRR